MRPEFVKLLLGYIAAVDVDHIVLLLPAVGDGAFAEAGGQVVVDPGFSLVQVRGAGFYGLQVRQDPLARIAGVDQGHGFAAVVTVPEPVADGDIEDVGDGFVGQKTGKAAENIVVVKGQHIVAVEGGRQQLCQGVPLLGGKGAGIEPAQGGHIGKRTGDFFGD